MATNINTILSWFKTGKKPTQKQFENSWQSFWHKEELIPQNSIQDLPQTLNNKAEKSQFDSHKMDPNAHAESIGGKLDKGTFPGTAENLDNRITALEMPDKVLKYGQINLSGLNLSIDTSAFAWVLNQISFLTPSAYAKTITAATDGMYRTDLVVGNSFGNYEIIKGTEEATGLAAAEPSVPLEKIKLGYVLVFGNTIFKSGNSNNVNLSGEICFPSYPNTRNDGQISMNKVLGTDTLGNLKMYTIAVAPAPYLGELIPDSYLPDTTGNFILKGAFFTPTMAVKIVGQTVNYINFISDNEVHVNVTTGSAEGTFDVILNNGLSATFPNFLMVVLGEVIKPSESDWTDKNDINVTQGDYAKVSLLDVSATAKWTSPIDYIGNFRVSFKFTPSPLANGAAGNSYFSFLDSSGNHIVTFRQINHLYIYYGNNSTLAGNYSYDNTKKLELRKIGSIITLHKDDGTLILTLNNFVTLINNLFINLDLKNFDVSEIKYIKTI